MPEENTPTPSQEINYEAIANSVASRIQTQQQQQQPEKDWEPDDEFSASFDDLPKRKDAIKTLLEKAVERAVKSVSGRFAAIEQGLAPLHQAHAKTQEEALYGEIGSLDSAFKNRKLQPFLEVALRTLKSESKVFANKAEALKGVVERARHIATEAGVSLETHSPTNTQGQPKQTPGGGARGGGTQTPSKDDAMSRSVALLGG